MTTLSRALPLSDKGFEQISQVSELDNEAARAVWRARVPSVWKSLLDSQTITPGAIISTPFAWEASSRRYIDMRSRRYVPFTRIRSEAIEPLILNSKTIARSFASGLQESGRLDQWESAMIQEVKISHIAASLAVNGGTSSQSEDDRDRTAEVILILLLLLKGFAFDIQSKRFPLNGRLFRRSDLYFQALRGTFEEIRRFGMGTYFGAVQERRVLGIADHCTDEDDPSGDLRGCVELSLLGWKPIGTLPRLGVSPCRSNCYCRFDYRYKDERGRWVEVDDSATVARILQSLNIKESIDE